jgi:3-hydroxyisobutyrate dehydrogenase-like beta-hydroxyacid dehydrogenase
MLADSARKWTANLPGQGDLHLLLWLPHAPGASKSKDHRKMSAMKVGVVGCGKMGASLAANLLKAGCGVVVCDRNPASVDALCKQGASSAATPRDLGQVPGLRAVVSMLPSPEDLREAYLGNAGLLTGAPRSLRPSLLIDSSTVGPEAAREVAAAAERTLLHPAAPDGHRHASMIDAPVSGGVGGAQAGTLTFMVCSPQTACSGAPHPTRLTSPAASASGCSAAGARRPWKRPGPY